jgi:hypothetical protein
MLPTPTDRLRHVIRDLATELTVATDDLSLRALRQALALLEAATETLDDLEKARKRAPRPVIAGRV